MTRPADHVRELSKSGGSSGVRPGGVWNFEISRTGRVGSGQEAF